MGIDLNIARFLLACKRRGVSFRRVGTIGRQSLFLEPVEIHRLFSEFELNPEPSIVSGLEAACGKFSEPFWRFLGAEEVVSFDASSYENATFTHDMNRPIPAEWKNRFDVVFDGGSLEHIFNFPTAIANCMNMIVTGGHFISSNPTNNFSGHGFYQFSAELYYRVFSESNGFRVLNALVTEPDGPFFEVPDPACVRRRVCFRNGLPVLLHVLARKFDSRPLFTQTPQQSDYNFVWGGADLTLEEENRREAPAKARVKKIISAMEKRISPTQAIFAAIRRYRHRNEFIRDILCGLASSPTLVQLPGYDLTRSAVPESETARDLRTS